MYGAYREAADPGITPPSPLLPYTAPPIYNPLPPVNGMQSTFGRKSCDRNGAV
jgi:hypothetical protein